MNKAALIEIAERIGTETWAALPPKHFCDDVINILEPKINGFDLVAAIPRYRLLTGP